MTLTEALVQTLKEQKMTISSAESCTGGRIASLFTSIPGASEWYKGSIVAYANEVKHQLLGVKESTLRQYGAVSQETVTEMAIGAMKTMKTECAVATSGIAGPGGGSPLKPVGTIWIAAGIRKSENDFQVATFLQSGDNGREQNVQKAVKNALQLLLKQLK